ncbi:MAG: CBS domain-containing protein [Candidatus Sumerlaeaceae bacterium]|nr:CBS domain-containing protein [Candidatus Sumerlaeaceae bacterium]
MPTVKDLLARKGSSVHTVNPEASVLDVTRLMNDHRIGAVVVVHEDRVVGIFSERDVLTRVVAAGRDPSATRVRDVMSSPVAYCTPSTPLDECRAIFTERRIRHLPVMEDNKLVGVITSGDLLAYDVVSHQQTIHYLEQYITS